jgi:hypothetical protein
MFNRLMDTSDPVMLGIAAPKLLANRRNEPLPREVLDVLANPKDQLVAGQEDMEVDDNNIENDVNNEEEEEEEEEQEALARYD